MNFCALICISADFLLPSYFPIQKLEYPSREFQALLMSELKKCWKFCQLCGNLAIFEKVLSWQIIQIHCASVKPVVKCQKAANECMYFTRQSFTRMPEVVVPQNIWLEGRTGWHDDSPSMPPTSPPPPKTRVKGLFKGMDEETAAAEFWKAKSRWLSGHWFRKLNPKLVLRKLGGNPVCSLPQPCSRPGN